jgi:hypothetical protein
VEITLATGQVVFNLFDVFFVSVTVEFMADGINEFVLCTGVQSYMSVCWQGYTFSITDNVAIQLDCLGAKNKLN